MHGKVDIKSGSGHSFRTIKLMTPLYQEHILWCSSSPILLTVQSWQNCLLLLFITLARVGGGYSTLCVCYHKIAEKFKLSQILNKLHLTNLVILDKQWFSTRQASSCRQTRLKWRVKLKTKKN